MPPAFAQPGPDHPAPSENARAAAHGRGADRHDWGAEGSVERSPLAAAEDAFGWWLVIDPVPLSLPGVERPNPRRRAVPLHRRRARMAAGRLRSRDRDAICAPFIIRARTSPSPVGRARRTLGCVGVALPSFVPMAARLSLRYPGDPADIEAAILSVLPAKLRTISAHTWTGDGLRSCLSAHGQDLDHGCQR